MVSCKVLLALALVTVASSTPTFLHHHHHHHDLRGGLSLKAHLGLGISGGLNLIFGKHRLNKRVCDQDTHKLLLGYKKPRHIYDIYGLVPNLITGLGGIIDTHVDGYGSLLARLVIAYSRISVCLNIKSETTPPFCRRDFSQFGIKGCGTNALEIVQRFQVINAVQLVNAHIHKYTDGRGIGSTKGFIYVMFKIGLEIAQGIDNRQNINKNSFNWVFLQVAILIGAFGNSYKADLGASLSLGIIKTCHPILHKHGYPGVLHLWQEVNLIIKPCNGIRGPFNPIDDNDGDDEDINLGDWNDDNDDDDKGGSSGTGSGKGSGNSNNGGSSSTGTGFGQGSSNSNNGGGSSTGTGFGQGSSNSNNGGNSSTGTGIGQGSSNSNNGGGSSTGTGIGQGSSNSNNGGNSSTGTGFGQGSSNSNNGGGSSIGKGQGINSQSQRSGFGFGSSKYGQCINVVAVPSFNGFGSNPFSSNYQSGVSWVFIPESEFNGNNYRNSARIY